MKIRIVHTLELDANDWRDEYGLTDHEDVRANVRSYVKNLLQSSTGGELWEVS